MPPEPEFNEEWSRSERKAWEAALEMRGAGLEINSRSLRSFAGVGQPAAVMISRLFNPTEVPERLENLARRFCEEAIQIARDEIASSPATTLALKTMESELRELRRMNAELSERIDKYRSRAEEAEANNRKLIDKYVVDN